MSKTIRLAKRGIIVVYILTFVGLVGVQIGLNIIGSNLSFSSIFYLLLILGVVLMWWIFKLASSLTLSGAFAIFVIAALFSIFGEKEVSETLMRVSFVGWLVGLGQALIESKKIKEHD